MYFNTITSTLNVTEWGVDDDQIPDPVSRAIERYATHPSILQIKSTTASRSSFSFSFRSVSADETFEIIRSLDSNKKTSGNIPVKILKLANQICHEKITSCVNKCISTCKFPDKLKLADIIPIHKKDDKSKKENYRPISILPTLSKVFEKVLLNQLDKFSQEILSPYLCGFRKGYSTQHALFNLFQNWQKCLDKSGVVGTLLMDLSKAYDCISPGLLVAKLAAYGLDTDSLRLLYNYLTQRKHRVRIGSSLSDWLELILGLPQGSILGPILFNFFINDLISTIQETHVCNFADDTTIYACENNTSDALTKLSKDCDRAIKWFQDNSMEANPNKFQLMFLGTKEDNLSLLVNGSNITSCNEVRLLGVTIDNKLTFEKHISNICCTAGKRTKALLRIRKYLNYEQAKCLTEAYIFSSFRYCPLIWMFGSKTGNTSINKVHYRALRALYQSPFSSFQELLQRGNLLTIHGQNIHSLLTEVYKCVHQLNPMMTWNYFTTKSASYDLRSGHQLELPPVRTIHNGLNSVLFRASFLWNSLPKATKESKSISVFQNNLHRFNLDSCTCKICVR